MNATLTERKVEITFREEYEGGLVVYTCQSQTRMNKVYYVRILNGVFDGCTCPTRRGIECKHATACLENEHTRATDLQQHAADHLHAHGKEERQAVHSCIYCGKRMKVDGWCGC